MPVADDVRRGRSAIIEQFLADGIHYMFGNPGTVEQGFLDELEAFDDFHYVLAWQEAVAVGLADGFARATAGPALVQLHSGVGLGNGIGMLYQAMRGHTPLLVIAGESGVKYEAMDAQMAVDLVAMARPVTKYATRVTHPSSVLRVLRRALKTAMTPPRGPVFVALPMDVLDEPNDEPVVPTLVPSTRTVPVPELLDRAARLLAGARRPVVLCGDGVAVSGAQDALVRVAGLLGADIWGVDYSEANVPSGHPRFRGLTGHMFGEVSDRIVQDADAVLVVGTYLFPEVFPSLRTPFAAGVPVVHVDLDAAQIAKNHPVTLGLVADPRETLDALSEHLRRVRAATGSHRAVDDAAGRVARTRPEPENLLERFAAALADQAPPGTVVFDEALTSSPALAKFLPPGDPGDWFLTRGGSLGVGIPGAVGIKLARPDATVIGFTGDGGSMYTIQALATAARHRIAAKFVICNNHRYELLDDNITQYWRERDIPSHAFPGAFDLSVPDLGFVDIARGHGVDAVRVERADQVDDAVKRLLTSDGPFLVDLVTAPAGTPGTPRPSEQEPKP